MATNNGSLKIGSITIASSVDNREWYWSFPGFAGITDFQLASLSNFKVDDESAFFSSDSSNVAIKSKVYNDLRIEAKKISRTIWSNSALSNGIRDFSTNSTVYANLAAMRDEAYRNKIVIATVKPPFKIYSEVANVHLYLPVQYDTVKKRAYLKYKGDDKKLAITIKLA